MPITGYPPFQPGSWSTLNDWLTTGWVSLSKSADETRSANAVLAADAVMQFPMLASTNYRIHGVIFFDTSAAADFKYDLNGPASPTLVRGVRVDCIAGGTPAARVVDVAAVGSTSLAGAGTTGGFLRLEFVWQNGVNAGQWSFRWAQDTSDASNTTVRAGSFLAYTVA